MMPSTIYKTEFNAAGVANVRGSVQQVFDTNAQGDLIPVGFLQEDYEQVMLRYLPLGKTYIQYTT